MSEKIMKVLANVSQDLTDGEKHQARSNIGAIAGVNVATAGGTTPLVPDENDRVTVDLTDVGNVPPFSGSDNGLVLGVVGSSDPELQWVSKGGGGTSYTAGDGIDIDTNDVISAKVDGTSIGVNASGELESLATVDQHYDASSTNAQSGTAVAEAMSGVSGVPSVGSGDDGKVLTANYTGGSGTFSWQDPPAQEQADWAQSNTAAVDFIKNKPTINNVPVVSSSDDGKVLTANYTGGVGSYSWVTPSGGSSYTAGNGINIANDTISAKVDGSSITVNSSGELQATASSLQTKPLVAGTGITFTASASDVTISADSQLPSWTASDANNSLSVNSSGTALEFATRLKGILVDTNGSRVCSGLTINTDAGHNAGLVRMRPAGGSNTVVGWLVPDGFSGSSDAGYYPTPTLVGSSPELRWKQNPADLKILTNSSITVNYDTNPYYLIIEDGYAYTLTMNTDREVILYTNSTDTIHSRVSFRNAGTSVCGGLTLTWHDEALVTHTIRLTFYELSEAIYYDFDVYIRRVTYNDTVYCICRVYDYPCAYRNGYTNGFSNDNINFIGRDYIAPV